jgi:hypothetical protein
MALRQMFALMSSDTTTSRQHSAFSEDDHAIRPYSVVPRQWAFEVPTDREIQKRN